ncbi:MAG: beta-propeller fold lactonase family protein [Leptospirales bacterium]
MRGECKGALFGSTMKPRRKLNFSGLTVAIAASLLMGCSFGHPLVGIFPGDESDESDENQLALGLIGGAALAAAGDGVQGTVVLRYAYVGGSSSTVHQFAVNDTTGVFTALSPATVGSGANVWDLEAHPNNNFMYAADRTGGVVYQYAVNALYGQLSPLAPATVVTTSSDPVGMAIHPGGAHAYVGFLSGSGIDMFSIDAATGLWTAKTPGNVGGCSGAKDMVFHPNGNFLFVVCDGGNNITRYSIDGAGQLTSLGGTGGIGTQPSGLGITPDGAYLYVTNQQTSQVFLFAVDGATGSLSALGTPSVTTDTWPSKAALDATGQYAYVNCWNGGAQSVRMYRIGAGTGLLSDNAPASISTGGVQPIDMRGDPTGRYIYALNSGSDSVNMYTIDSATGLLTSNGLQPASGNPRGIAFVTETVF